MLRLSQVSEEWVLLTYIITILGLLGFFVLEYADRKRAAETNSPLPDSTPQIDAPATEPVAPVVPVPEQPTTPDELRLAYCHRIVGLCNRLDLSAVDIKAATHHEAAELELGHVFTMLDVNHTEIDTEHPPAEREADEQVRGQTDQGDWPRSGSCRRGDGSREWRTVQPSTKQLVDRFTCE